MSDVIRQFSETVSDVRGLFRSCVMARDCGDGGWEGWLEFTPAGPDGAERCSTGIETRQHDRAMLERWASGLTHVYTEGALARARVAHPERPAPELLLALQEIVDALDRRIPHVERASEFQIAADAKRLRACAIQRMASLRHELRIADR